MFRGQRRPGAKWTRLDRVLLLGLQTYEDDCCPGCGKPLTYGMDPSSKGRWVVHTATCNACAALEKTARDRGDKRPAAGSRDYVAPDDPLAHAMHHPFHVSPFPA